MCLCLVLFVFCGQFSLLGWCDVFSSGLIRRFVFLFCFGGLVLRIWFCWFVVGLYGVLCFFSFIGCLLVYFFPLFVSFRLGGLLVFLMLFLCFVFRIFLLVDFFGLRCSVSFVLYFGLV